jgi:ABC-2 type transport system ATP-binding protein
MSHLDPPPAQSSRTPLLDVRNLRVDYGSFTAVHDLSLALPAGEIFGLAGPNGAGKTSTIRVLATLLEPTYGEVSVAGHDLFDEPDAVHEVIGYMPDLAPVIPDLKVWEFLDLYAHSHGLRGRARRERVDACLERVRLTDKRNVYGRALSRGMMQRVVLAKTLLHAPKLLLLDEPASGMDPIARRDLRRILQDLAADGAAIVISSHILSELSDMCTSVGIMHGGRLLEHGPIDRVISALEAESAQIRIEIDGDLDAAVRWLHEQPGVERVRVDGDRISLAFRGDRRSRTELLRSLVENRFDVSAFTPERSSIETLLMRLIDGDRDVDSTRS